MKRNPGGLPIAALVLLVLTGCAYFNTFYNAQFYYDSAISDLEKNGRTFDGKLPSKAKADFLTAIEKCHKVMVKYPDSRYIEEALFILGRSYYYGQEDGLSERYLNQLLADFPETPWKDEIRVWLARLHAQMGMYDQMDMDLEPIISQAAPDQDRLTEIYMLKGDNALKQNNKQLGIEHYAAAAKTATLDATRADIYHKLYSLAESDSNYEASLNYLSEFIRYTPNRNEQLEGRLTKVKLLQKLGKLDMAYREIKAMEGLTEFKTLIPGMRVQLANIEVRRGNLTNAIPMYNDIMEEFPGETAASDAAFSLATIQLVERQDIKKTQVLLRKVGINTLYHAEAVSLLKQLSNMEKLSSKIVELSKQLGMAQNVDPEQQQLEDASKKKLAREMRRRRSEEDEEETGDPGISASLATAMDTVEIDTAKIMEELAYSKYRLAEMTIFELQQLENGLDMMSEIIYSFDRTSLAPQAAYVMYFYSQSDSTQGEFWRSLLIEQYPLSQYAKLLATSNQLEITTDVVLDSLVENAYYSLDANNPKSSLEFFKTIRRTYNTDKASFAIGYLNDEYLNELDAAILAYEEYITLFPDGEQSLFVASRLAQLRSLKIESNGVSGENIENNDEN